MKMKQLLMTTFVTFGLTINSNAQVPNYVPSDGLVGWWPFNGNANDESLNGNNGTVNGATLTSDKNGLSNRAYSFDGSGAFINVPNSSSLQFNNQITISIWLNAFILNSPANYLLSKGADGGTPYSWTLPVWPTGLMEINLWNNNNGNYTISTSTPIITNQWKHVVITYDGIMGKTYLDGLINNSVSYNASIFSNIYDLKFGRRHYSGQPYFFNGKLDDIGIWNRALSEEEITSLFLGSSLGINEVSELNLFSVYPNPAQNEINVNTDAKLVGSVYTIYDNIGKAVKTGKLNSVNTTIELNDLSGGIYTFNLGENRKQTFKVIKK